MHKTVGYINNWRIYPFSVSSNDYKVKNKVPKIYKIIECEILYLDFVIVLLQAVLQSIRDGDTKVCGFC